MLEIKIGSEETALVDVTDSLENLTDLSGATPRYDVFDKAGTIKINGGIPTIDSSAPMTARCLINTAGWEAGHYFLYLRFLASPDSPRLGPLEFKVNP